MKPRKSKLSPDLDRWRRRAHEDERTTVMVRVLPSLTAVELRTLLERAGAEQESGGRGVVTARVTAQSLDHLAHTPGVLKIELPQLRFLRGSGPLLG